VGVATVTEDEWLASTYPESMLEFAPGHVTARQFRLLVAAAVRRVWPLILSHGRDYVVVLEKCADGSLSEDEDEFREAYRRADEVALAAFRGNPTGVSYATNATGLSVPPASASALSCLDLAANANAWATAENAHDSTYDATYSAALTRERGTQAQYIRDIFGNPFRPVAFDPAWRTEAVVALARGAYDDRAFDRLSVLADALEDAGCADANVLTHCRSAGPHVRGCWVVDLVLGKT
jgi:hypothetical protein